MILFIFLTRSHEEDAKEITATAQQALDNSRAAEAAIQEAIDLLENLLSILDDLKESEYVHTPMFIILHIMTLLSLRRMSIAS